MFNEATFREIQRKYRGSNREEVIENLTNVTQKLFTWFANNQMKANHDKCHLLLSTQEEANIQIANTTIKCSQSEKILGITR